MTTAPGLLFVLALAAAPAPRGEVLDFSAKWCGPCQQMAPVVARLERDGLPIRAIDVDAQRDLAERFNVTSMPTFVLVVDGREVDRHVGMMDEGQLRAWIQRIPTSSPIARLEPGTSSGFVADPNVKLGTPEALRVERDVPRQPEDTTPPVQSPPEIEYRGSDSLLDEPAVATSTQPAPMSASVRLRVTVDGKINLGSGTIISCSDGRALVMTCGHIFRGFAEDSRIEVNLFRGGAEPSFVGRLVKFDLESDVGLVTFETREPLPCVMVARDVQRGREQEEVLNIGCSGGQPPTAEELMITAVNPYLGPDNLECTGVPVQGRSGGGLFRSTGELIGICIAADPDRKRGVYAGLLAVHELLEAAGYASLFKTPETPVAREAAPLVALQPAAAPPMDAARAAPALEIDARDAAGEFPSQLPPRHESPVASGQTLAGTPVQIGADAADAEIVCIIRPRNQPESASQVVIIHQASPKLLSYLRGEMGTSTGSGNGSLAGMLNERRSREASVPTMGVAPVQPLGHSGFTPGTTSIVQKPTLQPTTLTEAPLPRRYVRSR
jgi:thiol-disulfide isomerase/thioredoxin